MRIRRIVRKRIQRQSDGINFAGDLNAVIAANVNEPGSQTHVRTRSSNRIVQRNGKTEITSDHDAIDESGHPLEVDK